MNTKSSGIRLKKHNAPFKTLAEFCNAVLRNEEIDLACFSDLLCEKGFVSVYLQNAFSGEGYGGGTLTIEAFDELRLWAAALDGCRITFSGKLKQKAS
ncbi:hypothetical protein GF391_01185 [Candidatus Uhrbacteria bacterium]|nr:hypothetical protein [Candidatus Uhrbacteria bacterium]